MRSLFAPLTGIDVQEFHVEDDVLFVEIRLSINQTNLTLEQVAAKMQKSHLDLLRLLIDDLKHAGAPDHTVDMLRSLENEQSKTEPDWFNSADNFGAATRRALDKQQEVYETIGKPSTWGLDEDGRFTDEATEEVVDERWKVTSKMRAVAQMAARLGERGFKSATALLRMALDPEHLKVKGTDRLSVPTPARQSTAGPPVQRRKTSLRESIREKMDAAIYHAFLDAFAHTSLEVPPDTDPAWQTMRIAFYILKEGAVQPWPTLLVKSLATLPDDPAYLKAFMKLLMLVLTPAEYENPFKPGASVLFDHAQKQHTRTKAGSTPGTVRDYKHEVPSRWEKGRIHKIETDAPDTRPRDSTLQDPPIPHTARAQAAGQDDGGGGGEAPARFDVQIRGTQVVTGLAPKNVLNISTAGVGTRASRSAGTRVSITRSPRESRIWPRLVRLSCF